jgi:hypothetical protein
VNGLDLVVQRTPKQAHLKVGLLLMGQRVENTSDKIDRLGRLDLRQFVDVYDFAGGYSLVHELTDRHVDLDSAGAAASRVRVLNLDDCGSSVSEQTRVVPNRISFVS